ncbi:hypothetical protein MBLNU459_g1075t1 [Dothideomycetes sp. NU459]
MLSPSDPTVFTPLPNEQTLYKSPPRTALSLQSHNKFPGREPFHVASSAGVLYLTNRRVIYLPAAATPQLQSFAAPILNTHDTHVVAPWIGPNVWTALVQPVQGGGIPAHHPALELRITFKEGGAYDFHSRYETVKERLQQAVAVARESGAVLGDGSETGRGRGGGALADVNVAGVHLDQLPAYEEASGSEMVAPAHSAAAMAASASASAPAAAAAATPAPPPVAAPAQLGSAESAHRAGPQDVFSPPAEPPPGYEEVQRETVEDELERRLRDLEQR